MTTRRFSLLKQFAAGFTTTWWAVFALVIVVPSVVLSVISLRLLDRLAQDEVADLVRTSEAIPWYYEEKMNRALEARAIHAARSLGYETLVGQRHPKEVSELFEVLAVEPGGSAAEHLPLDPLLVTQKDSLLPLADADGHPIGILRYRYSKAGLRTVLRECLNDRRAPWNDDSVEVFLGGPVEGQFSQDFDLHLIIRVNDPVLYERQGRTNDVRFVSKLTPDGFAVEVAVPWRHVGVRPAPGSAIRFDVTNNDRESTTAGVRDGQRTWAGYDRNWADPSQLGVLRLASQVVAHGPSEALALPAHHPMVLDGTFSEPEWRFDNGATKTEGRTQNAVQWGALWNSEGLFVGVKVRDQKVINSWSEEQIDWVLRITDPEGDTLLDSSADAPQVFSQTRAIDVRQLIAVGPLKGNQILFAFRDRPFTRRVERWKIGVVALVAGMDILLGFGLWLVFTNVKREMDLAALKSHFVATVSHEFKAPLALLRASAETLRGGRSLDEEKRRRYEGIIEAESQRLASLVDNVLSVSRIEAGRHYHFSPTTLRAVVDGAVGLHRLRLERDGFDVVIDVSPDIPIVSADAGAVQEALSNLIDNAIKYSRDKKHCRIVVSNANGNVEISVHDQGLGVARGDQERIFEKFYRGESEGHGAQGVGLGLSIARDIARAHGGDLLLKSEPGQGSTFTLILPKREPLQ